VHTHTFPCTFSSFFFNLLDEERKLKLLRLLRDGKPLTSVLDSDMASPVPISIKTAKDEEEDEEEWEDEVEEAEEAEEAE